MSRLEPMDIAGVIVREFDRYDDVRGSGVQLFDTASMSDLLGRKFEVGSATVLVNRRGVLRGFHLQQGSGREKYIACLVGEVFDAIVDLRPASSTFGDWAGLTLSGENQKALCLPAGVGHALLGISDESMVTILTTASSSSPGEIGVDPFDAEINVVWPEVGSFVRSPRDQAFSSLADLRCDS